MTQRLADPEVFSARLKQAMKDNGNMYQKELAAKTGIPLGTLKQYFTGRSVPHKNNLVTIARALNVNPDWLTGASEFKDRAKEEYDRLMKKLPYAMRYTWDRYNLYANALDLFGYDIKPMTDVLNSDDPKSAAYGKAQEILNHIDNFIDLIGNKNFERKDKTMMNTDLQETINRSIAQKAGIDDLQDKIAGQKEFTATDIKALQDALDLTVDQVQHLFF